MDHGKSQLHRRLPKTRQFDTHHRPTFRAAPGHRAGRLVCLKAVGSMGQPKRGRLRRVAVRTPAPGHASLPRHPCGVLTSLASSPVDHDVDPGGHGECPTECRHHLWPVDPDDEHPPGPLGNHIHDRRTASTPKLMTCTFRSAAEGRPVRPYQAPARRARRATGLPGDRPPSWACRRGRGRLSCPRRWSRGSDPHMIQIPPAPLWRRPARMTRPKRLEAPPAGPSAWHPACMACAPWSPADSWTAASLTAQPTIRKWRGTPSFLIPPRRQRR